MVVGHGWRLYSGRGSWALGSGRHVQHAHQKKLGLYILRLRPCRRPLLETGGCMMFDVFFVTLGAGGIVLASIWVLWMALG